MVFEQAFVESDSEGKNEIIDSARIFLIKTITEEVFPSWYGTPWNFNGMTTVPKEGSIACGYFVTTVLQDVGFQIPRIKWAQSASEVFIRKLSVDVKAFSNASMMTMKKYLFEEGNGLYLVGLDNHVGFLWVDDLRIRFIHSNYYQADVGVMSEDIHTENPFKHSSYRFIGKLFSNEMVENWIVGKVYH